MENGRYVTTAEVYSDPLYAYTTAPSQYSPPVTQGYGAELDVAEELLQGLTREELVELLKELKKKQPAIISNEIKKYKSIKDNYRLSVYSPTPEHTPKAVIYFSVISYLGSS